MKNQGLPAVALEIGKSYINTLAVIVVALALTMAFALIGTVDLSAWSKLFYSR